MKDKFILFAMSSSLVLMGCHDRDDHLAAYGVYGYAGAPVYRYEYYPDVEVYYAPRPHVYYWREGSEWRSGPRVPPHITLRSHVRVNLDSSEPYRHHDEMRKRYPVRREEEERERKH